MEIEPLTLHRASIPGNAEARAKLDRIMASGRAIAFVGAGASAELFPTWPALIESLVERAIGEREADDEDAEVWLSQWRAYPQDVATGLKEHLGGRFLHYVRELFEAPRGRSHTDIHMALARMPFRGYVTTNYDAGLVEARQLWCRDGAARDHCTWDDDHSVRKWLTDAVFQCGSKPILYAHGYHDDPPTMLLTTQDYRKAYAPGKPYAEVFRKLWGQGPLVFAGFGFSDPYLAYKVIEPIVQATVPHEAQNPTHVAIWPLTTSYSAEIRRLYRERYDVELLIYEVPTREDGTEDHSGLLSILAEYADDRGYAVGV